MSIITVMAVKFIQTLVVLNIAVRTGLTSSDPFLHGLPCNHCKIMLLSQPEKGHENTIAKMLLRMLSIGAEMENNQRKIRQREGIQLAKIKGVYKGRSQGARTSPLVLTGKYQNISDLLEKSNLSVRRIAGITGLSINTVRRI